MAGGKRRMHQEKRISDAGCCVLLYVAKGRRKQACRDTTGGESDFLFL